MIQINLRLDREQSKKVADLARQLRNTDQGVMRFALDRMHETVERQERIVVPPPRAQLGKRRAPATV